MQHTTLNPLGEQDAPTPTPRVPPGVEYHRVYAGEKRRILRGIFAIILLLVGLVCFAQLSLMGARLIDTELLGRAGSSPLQHAAGALSLVALVPYSMLLQRLLYGIPFRSLHSVTGRFRFGIFGRALLGFGPVVVIAVSLSSLMMPSPPAAWTMIELIAYFVIGMLLTPLAAAGEEYGFRGFMFRVVGGWSRSARLGTVIGIIIPTVFFSLFHGSLDPYILTSYLVLFGSMAVITWRTGGLETAVVLHGLYNITGLVLATTLHVDVAGQLNSRADATGSITLLIPSAAFVLITGIIWWKTRKPGPARTPGSPARGCPQNGRWSWTLKQPIRPK